MSDQRTASDEQPIERGADEEASGTPLTPTEEKALRTPPSQPDPDRDGGSDQAGSGRDS